jgi:hypothetical protein
MTRPTEIFTTPLGKRTDSLEVAGRAWNKLADAIADVGWVHHGTDDRGGWLTFWRPGNIPVTPDSSLMRVHVSYALSLYERLTGRAFEE